MGRPLKHAVKPKRGKLAPVVTLTPRPKPGVSDAAVERANRVTTKYIAKSPFAPYKPQPGVVPEGVSGPTMAMDDSSLSSPFNAWAMGIGWGAEEGQQFLGFPILSIMAQRGEYRQISETFATEATRQWIEFKSADGADKSEKIKAITREFTRLEVKDKTRKIVEHDCYFGRSHLFIDLGEIEGPEITTNLGDGLEPLSQSKVGKGRLRDIRVIEPVWCYPQSYNTNNALAPDFYKPTQWFVLAKPVHASRLLTFVSREVPDLLKAAYAFSGLATTQMARPYVDNYLDVRQATTNVAKAFTQFVVKTNMTDILAGGQGDVFFNRLAIFKASLANLGIMAVDKEAEDFTNVSAPITGLDAIQAQAQEHIAAITQIPLVKLTGISPSGLNASGDAEMQCWADRVNAYQEAALRPNLTKVLRFAQLSLFGDVDEDITFDFVPLVELTEQEEAELRKTNAETGEVLIRSKAVSSDEERGRVVSDLGGPYHGLDAESSVTYPMTEGEKAVYAQAVATTVATLVSEGIISEPTALREFMQSSAISDIGTTITDADVTEAENAPPPPSELAGPGEIDTTAAKGNRVVPPVTKGVKAEA